MVLAAGSPAREMQLLELQVQELRADVALLKEAFGLLLAGAIGNPLDKSKVDDVLKRLGYVPLSPLLVPGN